MLSDFIVYFILNYTVFLLITTLKVIVIRAIKVIFLFCS